MFKTNPLVNKRMSSVNMQQIIPTEKSSLLSSVGKDLITGTNFSITEKIEEMSIDRKDAYAMVIIGLLAWGVFKK